MVEIGIGNRIRKFRKDKHWTQQQLAEFCNFPGQWTVSRIETKRTDSLSTMGIICKALGIEVWELLRDAGDE